MTKYPDRIHLGYAPGSRAPCGYSIREGSMRSPNIDNVTCKMCLWTQQKKTGGVKFGGMKAEGLK